MPQTQSISDVIELDPRPAAAYLLGGQSRMVGDRLEACQRWPRDHLGLRPSLVVLLNVIDHAVLELRADIEEKVGQAIRKTLEDLKYYVIEAFSYQDGLEHWGILSSEADRALPSSHELFPFYDLGRIVGQYRLTTSQQDPNLPLPALNALFKKAQRVLDKYGPELPVLQSLVDLRLAPQTQPNWVLHQVIAKHSAVPEFVVPPAGILIFNTEGKNSFWSGFLDFIEQHRGEVLPYDEGSVAMSSQFIKLHDIIYDELATLRRPTSPEKKIPFWDEATWVLYFNGREIRRFGRKAENQMTLLTAFQEANWLQAIPDPFGDPWKLEKTITDLNKELAPGTISFHRRDGGTRVLWAPSK